MLAVEKEQEVKGVLPSEARRSDSKSWVLWEVWVLLQLALTPPASGSRAALRASPARSGAVAVERSHARTVVRECCKGNDESQWERVKFDPPPPKNPLTDGHHNLCR